MGVALVVDWVVSSVFLFGEFSQPGRQKKRADNSAKGIFEI
jgi:hypothetical protein